CGSELTRQGISLTVFPDRMIGYGCPSLHGVIPACRHADGTISSSKTHRTFDVWSLRIPTCFRAPAFPADCLAHRTRDEHLADCRCDFSRAPEDAPGIPANSRISLRQRSTLGP